MCNRTPDSHDPRAPLALTNGRVALPDRLLDGLAVLVADGRIAGLGQVDELGDETPRLDVGGRLITPGLVDIHTHGALGHTFNEPDEAAYRTILVENARRGVTAVGAALATAPLPDLLVCLAHARVWMQTEHEAARLLGVYLESPYINAAYKGALDPSTLRTPDDGSVDDLLAYADALRVFMLAPELPGALPLVERLSRLGLVVAAGHSGASDDDVLAAMRAGLTHVTHIWSAMSSVARRGPWRVPGLLETALTYDGLTVEMIADNRHLPPTLMKLAYKCIGPDRLCAVSDATSGAGLPDGSRFGMGGMWYEVRDGVGMMLDRSAFAGSSTLLNQMIPILTGVVGATLPEALRMVTLTPARAVRADGEIGSIEPGKRADLAIFNEDFTAWRTMVGGKWTYVG